MTKGKLPWIVFLLTLAIAILYLVQTIPRLPPMVASHFDIGGYPNAFMTRGAYTRFILGFAVGLPIAIVALLTFVYAGARDFKLPNRDYWLAAERIAGTRAFLIAHGVWFRIAAGGDGLLRALAELAANRSVPPQLSIKGQHRTAGLLLAHRRMDHRAASGFSTAASGGPALHRRPNPPDLWRRTWPLISPAESWSCEYWRTRYRFPERPPKPGSRLQLRFVRRWAARLRQSTCRLRCLRRPDGAACPPERSVRFEQKKTITAPAMWFLPK